MSGIQIETPFPIFNDIDGQPLENGYIFIGAVNLNPITNPVATFFNAALTIPATQPIRTLGGYPINSGTPARFFVGSDYSIQVQNRNGSVIYTSLNGNAAGGGVGWRWESLVRCPRRASLRLKPFARAVGDQTRASRSQRIATGLIIDCTAPWYLLCPSTNMNTQALSLANSAVLMFSRM